MSRKLIFLGVICLVLAPGAALSLGLGEIRLNSYLNQPLDAEIGLTLSAPTELETLRVGLASTESFSRAGLPRPAYFDDLEFRIVRTAPGSALIRVSSSAPIVEPFMTFLVEATWSGGRMVREYTVLLDPPVFLPSPETQAAPAPAVAPPRPAPESVSRPAPAPAPVAPAAPAETVYAAEQPGEYGPVQRNETLWGIAQRVRPDPGLTTNQVMVALFEANPQAFDGNINRLRAGAILRVPSRDRMAANSAGQAMSEVRRQNQSWSPSSAAAAPAPERRLELAPPADVAAPEPAAAAPAQTAPDAPAGAPAGAASGDAVLEAVEALRSELAETRRLMELKDAEIAALQSRLGELESQPPAAAPTGEPETTPAAEPEPEPAKPVAAVPAPVQPAPTMLDRALALLGSLWLWLVLAVALVVALMALALKKRRGEEARSIEEELAQTGTWDSLEPTGADLGVSGGGAAAAAPKVTPRPRRAESSIEVEETAPEPPRAAPPARPEPAPERRAPEPAAKPAAAAAAPAAAESDYEYPFEDTIASGAGVDLDQSDPLAEADFHMAYGLYDQAADIIKKAIAHEPDRYDLKRKLVDICFVWGNAAEFLAQARAMRTNPSPEAEADWPKIAIMGRQICPGEALFEGGGDVALDLDLGEALPEEAESPDPGASGSWLDFDVGEAESEEEFGAGAGERLILPPGDTQEQRALDPAKIEESGEIDLDELGIDLELGESGEYALRDLAEPAPMLSEDDEALMEPGEDVEEAGTGAGEEDEGTMMMDVSRLSGGSDDPTQRGEGFEVSSDAPTVAGEAGFEIDDESDETLLESLPPLETEDEPTLVGVDSEFEEDAESEQTLVKKLGAESPAADEDTPESDDLDLDDLTAVLRAELEQDRGAGDVTAAAPGFEEAEEPAQDDTGSAEAGFADMDEIGTKLDLARAYVDMGDPDGARSILEEVAAEGNEAQQEEARQLLDSLG